MDDYDRGYLDALASALRAMKEAATIQEAVATVAVARDKIVSAGGIY